MQEEEDALLSVISVFKLLSNKRGVRHYDNDKIIYYWGLFIIEYR